MNRKDKDTKAYKMGKEACEKNIDRKNNPFLKGMTAYYEWNLGWIDTYNKRINNGVYTKT